MNDNLCAESGYVSLNKAGETLCGDRVEIVGDSDNLVLVLADGLGSGVKANILSTLTAKILGTMIAGGMLVDECVDTMIRTLPVCRERGIAYSTFTVIHATGDRQVRLIQFDNPEVIALRDGVPWAYPSIRREVSGREILESRFEAREGDVFLALSDGATYAGAGRERNYGWQRENIVEYARGLYQPSLSAKAYATAIADACMSLYGGSPGDDTTIAAVRLRARRAVSVAFGPPSSKAEDTAMMNLFFGKGGMKVVCGGTTAAIAARYLRAPLRTSDGYEDPEVPPISRIEGVDLATEGVLTVTKALSYLECALRGGEIAPGWYQRTDGASLLARALIDEATDVNFFVGRAVNPANGSMGLAGGGAGAFPEAGGASLKARLVQSMAVCLEKMGKRVKISYF
jgi:hypothetical protein